MLKIIAVALCFIWLIGQAIAEDPLQTTAKKILFNYEDSTSGNGYFASFNKLIGHGPHSDARVNSRLADVFLYKRSHGSGLIEKEAIINSTELNITQIEPDMIYAYALIAFLGSSNMAYKSQTMPVGAGYFAAHQVNFDSLLSDTTQIKNYASKTSMVQEAKQAKAINTNLLASVEDDYTGWNPSQGVGRTLMNLDMNVTNGSAHIGMLQGKPLQAVSSTCISCMNVILPDFDKSAWHEPIAEVSEDYTGTFNIATKMNLTLPVFKIKEDYAWLPCCSGGWDDMNLNDQRYLSAKGFFDCIACYKGLVKEHCT